MKKIKIFLGAYVNSTNAQNINCKAIAKNIDKKRFQPGVMTLYSGKELNIEETKKIKIFKAFYPHKFSKYYVYLRGIFWADVVYLPKGEIPEWIQLILVFIKRKSFITVESIFDEKAINNIQNKYGSLEKLTRYYSSFDKIFSITKYLKKYNEKNIGLRSEDQILYLGADIGTFLNTEKTIDGLSNIVLIGNDLVRKGVYDYFELAKSFPNIIFHIVGTGNGKIDVLSEVERREISNIKYHGGLTHDKLIELLNDIDLHILPSRSEGFPKVTLETAAAGVPSLVYDDYGADEWITHGENGYIVHTMEEMKETIKHLKNNPKELQEVSQNAIEMAKRFDWRVVIKEWERVIEELFNEKKI